jgi:hypothetical protein
MKLNLGDTLVSADLWLWTCEWSASEDYGQTADIVRRIQAARSELAEARRLYEAAHVAALVAA